MNPRRAIVVAILVLAPFAFLTAVGSYHLYSSGWGFIAWWPMAGCFALAYFLSWRWTRKSQLQLLPDTGISNPPTTWTDRDRQAWKVVERRAASVSNITVEQVADPQRYADTSISLALEIAQVYQPGATDPFGHLTLPEIVTCAELVARDLHTRVTRYIPGSHMLCVDDWKQAKKAIDWGKTALDLSWLARAVINPINTGMQYAASKASGSIFSRVQDNVLLWFHTAYIHELGKHLIELNSGRLKVGADKYRALTGDGVTIPPTTLDIAIVGQVKSGKSSLVNALLGEGRAATDVLPMTTGATKYELKLPDREPMTLVDTVGYGADGPSDRDVAHAAAVAGNSDLILFVAHARSAARKSDLDMLAKLTEALEAQPQLRVPPILVALTHSDLLTPAMEWSPPYDWRAGTRTKENQIREAVGQVRSEMGERILAVIPVCTAPGKVWNVDDELIEAMAATLDEARGTALLRVFHREGRAGATRKTVDQVMNAGREALGILWNSVRR